MNETILKAKCIGCHFANGKLVSLDGYDSVVKAVVPGDANKSPLFLSVQNNLMPLGSTPLSPDAKKLMSDWITDGAQNN